MDLRVYYKRVREIEGGLTSPFVVMVSIETPDGGKAGVFSEVATLTAAKHIAEGRARAATPAESEAFHLRNLESKQLAEHEAAANKMQFVVVPARTGPRTSKE